MNRYQIRHFIDSITPIILQAGELATKSQGKVVNVGKETIEIDKSVVERIKQRGRAKTEIDEKIQEMLLLSIMNVLGKEGIRIDAEEDTPSKKLFNDLNAYLTVVLDPIDGTLEYVSGNDRYSINVGLIEKGKLLTTLIYSPFHKRLYYLDDKKTPFLVKYNNELNLQTKKELKTPLVINQNIVYVNNRVPIDIIESMRHNGFTVVEDDGIVVWPEGILKCITGEYTASIFHTPQTRDVLLGGIIENLPGGYKMDWEGKSIMWPDGGRIPRIAFGFGSPIEKLINCLNN